MAYENIRKKLNKYAKGGKMIPKYAFGSQFSVLPGTLEEEMKRKMLRQQQAQALGIDEGDLDLFSDNELNQMYMNDTTQRFDLPQPETDANEVLVNVNPKEYGSSAADQINTAKQQKNAVLSQQAKQANKIYNQYDDAEDAGNNGNLTLEQSASATQAAQNAVIQNQVLSNEKFKKAAGITNAAFGALGFNAVQTDPNDEYISEAGQLTMGIVSQAVDKTLRAVDEVTMGDKNFSARSDAADSVVHGASGALMKSGNPYAMCCLKDTIVFTSEGKPILIQDLKKEDGILGYYNKQIIAQPIKELFPPLYKESIQIETEGGTILRCSIDHPIYSALEGRARYFTVGKKKQRRIKEFSFRRADTLKVGDFVAEAGSVPFFGSQHVKLSYLIGLLIGDGTYGKGHRVPRLFTGDSCTWKWLKENNLGKMTAQYYPGERYSKEFREYSFHGLQSLLRECGIYGQSKKNKRLPINLHKWDKNSCAALLAGLFDTDGFVQCDSRQHAGVSLSQSNIELLKQIKLLLLKFGIHCTIQAHPAKDQYINGRLAHSGKTYVLNIKTRESIINFYNNITLNIDYKQKRLQKAYLLKLDTKSRDTSLEFYNIVANKIKRIIKLGYCKVYNLSADISHTYLADGIVTHNTAGAVLEGLNFITKAGGKTVPGYDVNINNSGYGNLGHQESSSGRIWDSWTGKTGRKLAKRNEQARMALNAASISEDQAYEQEARANSITNVLEQNQIALAGGIDTSLLGN